MLTTVLPYTVDLSRPLQLTPLRTTLLTGDHEAHAIRLSVTREGEAVDLSRAAAHGYFLRGDGTTVLVDGLVSADAATLVFPEECYAAEGRFSFVVQLHLDGVRHSALWLEGNVARSRSDLVVSDTIPSLDELLARIDEMNAATLEAHAAAAQARALISDNTLSSGTTWSSEKLTKELCPDLRKVGLLVTCRPAPHLTLDVAGTSLKLIRTGRNIVNIPNGTYDSISYYFPVTLPAGVYTLSFLNASASLRASFTSPEGVTQDVDIPAGSSATVIERPHATTFIALSAATLTNVQLEAGAQAFPFEPYTETVTDIVDGAAQVTALEGVNTLWADEVIVVTGLASPAAAFGELAERGAIPLATAASPGAVKVGAGLKVTADGTLSATGQGGVADSVAWEDIIDKPSHFNPAPHTHPELTGGSAEVDMSSIFNQIYPIGSIYMSMQSTYPGALFGGEWSQIQDRFLLASGSYAAGGYGGASSVVLSHANLPPVGGQIQLHSYNNGTPINSVDGCFSAVATNDTFRNGGDQGEGVASVGIFQFSNGGQGVAHENMPPYLTVHMWMRVA